MKTKRTMKSIAAAALALSLAAVPAAQNAVLTGGFSFGIMANAEDEVSTAAELKAAIADASGGDTITVADGSVIELSECLVIGKAITLNLGTAEIKATQKITATNGSYSASLIHITASGNVTINGGTLNGGGTAATAFDHYVVAINAGANVTLAGTEVTNNSGENAPGAIVTNHSVIANYGTLTLDGAKVTSITDAAAVKTEEGTTLNITNGSEINAKDLGVTNWGETTVDGGSKVISENKAFNAFNYNDTSTNYPSVLTINDAVIDGGVGVGASGNTQTTMPKVILGEEAEIKNFSIEQHPSASYGNGEPGKNTDVDINGNAKVTLKEGVDLTDSTSALVKGLGTDVKAVTVTKADGTTVTVLGGAADEAVENLAEGDSIELIKNVDEINVPAGVEVENSTGSDVTVNGSTVADGAAVEYTEVAAVPAGCETEGNILHYTTGTGDDIKYYTLSSGTYTEVTKEDITVAAAGHDYAGQEVEYVWSENSDGTKVCTAKIVCANSSAHILNIPAYGVEVITKPATTEEEGSKYYKATFTLPAGVTGVTLTEQHTDPEAIPKLTLTEAEKIAAIKPAVANALKGITVTNATTKAEIETAVNAAVAETGIEGVTVTTAFTITPATEEAPGTAQAVVTVGGSEQVKHDYSIVKLPASEKPGTEDPNKPGTEDPNKPGTEDPNKPGTEDPNKPGTEDPNKPGTEDPNKPGTEDPNTPVTPAEKTDAEKITDVKKALDGTSVNSELKFSETDNGNEIIKIINTVLEKAYNSDVRAVSVSYGKPDSDNRVKYTVTLKLGDVTDTIDITFKFAAEDKPAPAVTYYTVSLTGDYLGSGVTVSSSRNTAGATVTVNVPVGYEVTVVSGSSRIAYFSDNGGTFTMPAGNVTLNVTSYLGMLSSGYKNAYIYSYDSGMNHIKTNSVRGGMTSPEGEVTVKLGSEYAGKSVTLYNGRKSTSSKVDEAVLDSRGQATFSVKSGKNYTLVVE